MWDLIVSVPDHCLSFYFEYIDRRPFTARGSWPYHLSFRFFTMVKTSSCSPIILDYVANIFLRHMIFVSLL